MREHIRVAGWLHLILGGLTLLGGVFLFLIFGGLAGAASSAGGHDAGPIAALFAGLGAFALFIVALFSLPNLLLGWGLLTFKSWARVVGIVVSGIGLLHPAIGVGTLINIYSLWVFFQPETAALFNGASGTLPPVSPYTY